jgi:hypothetical protein
VNRPFERDYLEQAGMTPAREPGSERVFDDHRPVRGEGPGDTTPSAPGGSYHKHSHVKIMAVFYTFWALLSLALVLLAAFKIVTEDSGYLVMFFVFGFIGALTGYQAKHYLSDLGRQPVIAEGEILRKWHKGNLLIFLFPSFYVFVDDKIFSIPRQDYALLLETDLVRISHYPGSLTVDFVERYDSSEKRYVPTTHGVSL